MSVFELILNKKSSNVLIFIAPSRDTTVLNLLLKKRICRSLQMEITLTCGNISLLGLCPVVTSIQLISKDRSSSFRYTE